MSLTGQPLMLLLMGLTIAAIAAAAWLSPRVSGTRVAHVAGRAGLLIAGQLIAVLTTLAVVNDQYDFYHSWGDLVGTVQGADNAPAAVKPSKRPRPSAASVVPPRQIPRPVARRPPRLVEVSRSGFIDGLHFPPSAGKLESVTLHGQYSGISSPAYVYLPPQYFLPQYRNRRFPVILSLTGYPGNAVSTITKLKLPEIVSSLIDQGKMQPTIFIMMRPTVAGSRDTECTDVPGGPQVGTFFALDVPAAMQTAFRVPSSPAGWGIQGDSTGGYCALKITMMHSERYNSAISLAGDYHAPKDFFTKDLYAGSQPYRNENDLIWRLQNLPPPPVNLLLTSSRVGESDYKDTLRFLSLARLPMVTSSIILPSGGHHFSVWQSELYPALQWISAHMKAG